MSNEQPVGLTEQDMEVLELMRSANEKYQVYLDLFERQSKLVPKRQPQVAQQRSWDYPLGLVLRSERDAFVE